MQGQKHIFVTCFVSAIGGSDSEIFRVSLEHNFISSNFFSLVTFLLLFQLLFRVFSIKSLAQPLFKCLDEENI